MPSGCAISQPPPQTSWTGKSKVPVHAERAEYVDELGCASSLRDQLAALAGETSSWELRMHLAADPVVSLLHMASASALID